MYRKERDVLRCFRLECAGVAKRTYNQAISAWSVVFPKAVDVTVSACWPAAGKAAVGQIPSVAPMDKSSPIAYSPIPGGALKANLLSDPTYQESPSTRPVPSNVATASFALRARRARTDTLFSYLLL